MKRQDNSANKFYEYERRKAAIRNQLLTPEQYAKAIRQLSKELGV